MSNLRPEDRPDLFLPDPVPRAVRTTVISVDDHLVEPADMFEGRLPSRLQDRAPAVEETSKGRQIWRFDGNTYSQVGMNAVAGRRPESVRIEPFRFDEMRKGCWDVDARVRDMDLGGIWASVNFPSQITGFCGSVFSNCSDPELGLAVTRAWNDWFHDEWATAHPDRIIPLGITWLADPELGADEIRRNAHRGFKAVTLPERPHRIGLPTLFEGYWDPIIAACEETGTVIALHVGSSGLYDFPPGPAPLVQLGATLFGQLSLTACTEWLWSEIPVRFPEVRIAMSEGGIGWVAMLLDRLDNVVDRSGYGKEWPGELRPSEVVQRNFWFCTIDDPSTIDTRERIGLDHIMIEVDYPHGDTTWPDTQAVIADVWGHLPTEDLHRICHANAAELFRHPLPEPCCPDTPAPMAGHPT